MTAGSVFQEMDERERFPFLAGVIEGLAFARFEHDEKNPAGMQCIYTWFYESDSALDQIHTAFTRFENHTPAAVMAALIKRRCGE